MRELSACLDIDEVSKVLQDPLVLASLLLKRGGQTLVRSGGLRSLIKALSDFARDRAGNKELVYARLSGSGWGFRLVVFDDVIAAAVMEVGTSAKTGLDAFAALSELYAKDESARMVATSIRLDEVHPGLRQGVEACARRKGAVPQVWVGRELFRLRVEGVVSSSGGYSYVLSARDSMGRLYALKVVRGGEREELDSREVLRVLRGAIEALEVASVDDEEVSRGLERLGLDPALARELASYRRYIAIPRGIIVVVDRFDYGYYVEYPPALLEDFADRGDLEALVRGRGSGLGPDEVLYVAIRLCGALALVHSLGMIHADVKPRNVLLASDPSEPRGYRPLLSDFSGCGRVSRGFRLARATPAYADPVMLALERVGPRYDVYSTAMTICFAARGEVPKPFVVASATLLRTLYGVPIDVEALVSGSRELEELCRECARVAALPNRGDRAKALYETLEPFADRVRKELVESLGALGEVVAKGLELDLERRYGNCVEMWMDLKRVAREMGLERELPRV